MRKLLFAIAMLVLALASAHAALASELIDVFIQINGSNGGKLISEARHTYTGSQAGSNCFKDLQGLVSVNNSVANRNDNGGRLLVFGNGLGGDPVCRACPPCSVVNGGSWSEWSDVDPFLSGYNFNVVLNFGWSGGGASRVTGSMQYPVGPQCTDDRAALATAALAASNLVNSSGTQCVSF